MTIDEQTKLVRVDVADEGPMELPFDVVSFDVGSAARDFESVPGASRFCLPTRPISDLLLKIEREEERLRDTDRRVVVVGGGAAGVELALALRARWNDAPGLSVVVLDSNDRLLPSESPACRDALKAVLDERGIEVRPGVAVREVSSASVRHGDETPYDLCLWAAGAEAHPLAGELGRACGLATSGGWILVDERLRSVSHPCVFAAGDCCQMEGGRSPPKAGVYAVRAGPVLIENLTRALGLRDDVGGADLVAYRPQEDFLKILACGDGTALGFRFGIPFYGTWVWRLKDHIDRTFMDLFDAKLLPTCDDEGLREGETKYDASQYDDAAERPPPLPPMEAGELLSRTDDDVDFRRAWDVLRDMMANDEYKAEVLSAVELCRNSKRDR